ncbi:MAG TPA: hypothetical protein PKK06_08585 [Phycisphaerae bacterium]|nr:hypothetical protein [Phycisphaerae bacterium]HNU45234.1 hypothetical protein [Phycisphaerae bacterium]
MLRLDPSQLAPEVASLLLLRGAELPPLQWSAKPVRLAKEMLNGLGDDTKLLGCASVASQPMAAAVRALLYLWNGHLADCATWGRTAPPQERIYLDALAARHAGQPDNSKTLYTQLGAHVILSVLHQQSGELIGLGVDPLLARFKGILVQAGEWEPYMFIDLYEQARAGKLSQATEQIIRQLQSLEYELLFTHCYEAARGMPLPARPAATAPPRRKPALAPARRPARKPQDDILPAARAKTPAPPPKCPAVALPKDCVGIMCPKCGETNVVPDNARGRGHVCRKCQAQFLVPPKKAPVPAARST